ncbi:hypothetical protein ACT3SQ_01955 [Brachybacterium sp. AOP42-C2-15]
MSGYVAALVAVGVAPLTAAPVSFGATTGTIQASSSFRYYVYVPSFDAASSAACTVTGGDGVTWTAEQIDLPAKIVDTEYTQIGTVSVTADQQVTLSCTGVADVAVAALGMRGTVLAFSILLVSALALLGGGIVARRRSRGPERSSRHEWF